METFRFSLLALVGLIVSLGSAQAEPPRGDANDIAWVYPDASYSGGEFVQAFRYRTLVGGRGLPTQAGDVCFGEAEWAPGAIYTRPNAIHRMVNIGDGILKTVWMWWGEPDVLYAYPEIVEPIEKHPKGVKFQN